MTLFNICEGNDVNKMQCVARCEENFDRCSNRALFNGNFRNDFPKCQDKKRECWKCGKSKRTARDLSKYLPIEAETKNTCVADCLLGIVLCEGKHNEFERIICEQKLKHYCIEKCFKKMLFNSR